MAYVYRQYKVRSNEFALPINTASRFINMIACREHSMYEIYTVDTSYTNAPIVRKLETDIAGDIHDTILRGALYKGRIYGLKNHFSIGVGGGIMPINPATDSPVFRILVDDKLAEFSLEHIYRNNERIDETNYMTCRLIDSCGDDGHAPVYMGNGVYRLLTSVNTYNIVANGNVIELHRFRLRKFPDAIGHNTVPRGRLYLQDGTPVIGSIVSEYIRDLARCHTFINRINIRSGPLLKYSDSGKFYVDGRECEWQVDRDEFVLRKVSEHTKIEPGYVFIEARTPVTLYSKRPSPYCNITIVAVDTDGGN